MPEYTSRAFPTAYTPSGGAHTPSAGASIKHIMAQMFTALQRRRAIAVLSVVGLLAPGPLPILAQDAAAAADLPIRQVTLYKHGVGSFVRQGDLAAGSTARLDFKAGDMDDVLKSLTIVDQTGAPISGVRYDASEPVERRLEDFPFRIGDSISLAAFLDQMKGAQLELEIGTASAAGTILSARTIREENGERETVVLLTPNGDIRGYDLGAATTIRLTDPRLQDQLRSYLTVLSGSRSRDRRSVYIDSPNGTARQISASYMTPAPMWKSSYRLLFGEAENPTLEGWAIVDNTSGDDWDSVNLSVVSGRPISFITQLYEPRYVDRPHAELADALAVGPQVYGGAITNPLGAVGVIGGVAPPPPAPAQAAAEMKANAFGNRARPQVEFDRVQGSIGGVAASSIAANAAGRDLGELFEYNFETPVTVKAGESAMLPFLQHEVDTRKLLIYEESYGVNPMNAAEITNNTGSTLDGGPITVYDKGAYAGEALVETVKTGDKRLISYGVDLGTRVTTAFNTNQTNVREMHYNRGVLDVRNALQEKRTFTIRNVDPEEKTLIIQHPKRPGYELLDGVKPLETTDDAYRFEVVIGGNATREFQINEERLFNQSYQISNMTPDVLSTWVTNRALSAEGRRQLELILDQKRELAQVNAAMAEVEQTISDRTEDERRIRDNINSLRNVQGQQTLVQQYATQLSEVETQLVGLRDQQAQLRRNQSELQLALDDRIASAEF